MIASAFVAAAVAASAVSAAPAELQRRGPPTTAPGALGFAYPPLRGWTQSTASVAPCGGYALGGRTDYPLSGGDLSLIQQRDGDDFQLMYSTNADPQSVDDFQTISTISKLYPGTSCMQAPNFASLGLSAGAPVTFLTSFTTGPQKTRVYQCADVNLVEAANFVATMEYECRNFTSSTQTRGGGNTAAVSSDKAEATQASSTVQFTGSSADDSKISKAAAGGIGAAAAIAFVAALLAVLGFTGFVSFGKKSKKIAQDAPASFNSDADTLRSMQSVAEAKHHY
ncbi:hypothetical protein P389DRAFT_170341 [Cystobasidium minutum MCA 4210]|uniref:uncharacterized protein n=1 Tax=Cystobasidium minutum MCA 4210 TaxID=1397322 RepID=UPI0034CD19A9|eukprot:jgi/Rhomi1/170341/fgenesh1_kg.4_\